MVDNADIYFIQHFADIYFSKCVCISVWEVDGWMDELGFYIPSSVFQSFRDDGRVNMKGSVQ